MLQARRNEDVSIQQDVRIWKGESCLLTVATFDGFDCPVSLFCIPDMIGVPSSLLAYLQYNYLPDYLATCFFLDFTRFFLRSERPRTRSVTL